MVGKATYEKYAGGVNKSTALGAGAFTGVGAGGLFSKDGSGTDRSTYHYPLQSANPGIAASGFKEPQPEKSYTSPPTHGAVSALNLVGAGLSTRLTTTAATAQGSAQASNSSGH
jgi:hypothetical protein